MPTLTSVTKHFITSQEGFTTTTAGSVVSGAATVTLNSVSGYTNGDQVAFVIDPTDVTKKQVFTGTIDTSGVQVTNVVWTEGTNQTHAAGATVVDYTTATHQAAMVKGVKVSLDDDGTLKAGAVDNSAVIADGIVTNAKLATGAGEPGGEWQTYTPTLAGWSGTPTVVARYKQIGKIVYVTIGVDGTSNSATTTISLPVASQGAIFTLCRTSDGSTDRVGILYATSAGSTLMSRLGFQNGSGSSLFTTWAASGAKVVSATTFMYEAA